jgi:hypothetical protein
MASGMRMEPCLMCVRRQGELQADHLNSFVCCGCGAAYPTVDDIGKPVLKALVDSGLLLIDPSSD